MTLDHEYKFSLTFDLVATLDHFDLGVERICIKFLAYCRLNTAVERSNSPFYPFQTDKRASKHQYTIIGYVQNGYYPVMKYNIRILREIRGWLLSSQKAVWLLTIRYFRWLSLDFHLDRGQRSEYRIYWSVTPLLLLGTNIPNDNPLTASVGYTIYAITNTAR